MSQECQCHQGVNVPVNGLCLKMDLPEILSREEILEMIRTEIAQIDLPVWETLVEDQAWKMPNGMIIQKATLTLKTTTPAPSGAPYKFYGSSTRWTYPVAFASQVVWIGGTPKYDFLENGTSPAVEGNAVVDKITLSAASIFGNSDVKDTTIPYEMIAIGF